MALSLPAQILLGGLGGFLGLLVYAIRVMRGDISRHERALPENSPLLFFFLFFLVFPILGAGIIAIHISGGAVFTAILALQAGLNAPWLVYSWSKH